MARDAIIAGGRVFDGSGGVGKGLDVAIKDCRIAAVRTHLPTDDVAIVHDASGKWVTPGLLDIHTHEDLEAELDPGLTEVVRHGITSVVVC